MRLPELDIQGLVLVWGFPQGSHRSTFLARALGMNIEHAYLTRRQGKLHALYKYPIQAAITLRVLARRRPQVVIVQNPPIFAAMVVYLWACLAGVRFIIDSHTDALQAAWWAWSLPLHGFLARRAITTIVTNDHLKKQVVAWHANAFVLMDPPFVLSERCPVCLDKAPFNVVVVSTASYDEPIAHIMEAAGQLPDVAFHVTGNFTNQLGIVAAAPPNVRFTGYVPDAEYYGLLEAAQVVMCLTTENHTIQSGAGEALWLGKPIITSDWPLLREYFSRGTMHVDNSASSILRAVLTMKDNLPTYEAEIQALEHERRCEWRDQASALIALIQNTTTNSARGG